MAGFGQRSKGRVRTLQGSGPMAPVRGALNTGSGVQGLRGDEFVSPNSSAGFPSYGLGRGVSGKGAEDGRGSVWLFW